MDVIVDQLYLPIPEFKFPVDELKAWGLRNQDKFRDARENKAGLYGCLIPYKYTKILNDQICLDLAMYNASVPLVSYGQLYIVEKEYPMHTDPRRDCSLNFLLGGESVTMWEGGTVCPYQRGQAMLFNTQVKHAVFVKESDEPRMAVSFNIIMGFPRFVNLYREGLIFNYRERIVHLAELMPS